MPRLTDAELQKIAENTTDKTIRQLVSEVQKTRGKASHYERGHRINQTQEALHKTRKSLKFTSAKVNLLFNVLKDQMDLKTIEELLQSLATDSDRETRTLQDGTKQRSVLESLLGKIASEKTAQSVKKGERALKVVQ